MNIDRRISQRLVLTLLPVFLFATLQSAEAGLLGGGSRPKGSSGGLLSPAEFNCIYENGYTLKIDKTALQESEDIGELLDPRILEMRAILSGNAECTTTTGAPNFEPTAQGSCSFEFVYKLPSEEPACEPVGNNSRKTYALSCADIPANNDPTFVTGQIACKKEDLTLFEPEAPHPCKDLGPDGLCGVSIGIAPDGFVGLEASSCSQVFGTDKLFEINQTFVGSANCGFDVGKRTISFEVGDELDRTALPEPITPDELIGPTASIECDGGDDDTDLDCYYMGYGPPGTAFRGADGKGNCDTLDTPESMVPNSCAEGDEEPGIGDGGEPPGGAPLGFIGMTDQVEGPTDEIFITFSDSVDNPNLQVIDYVSGGGTVEGDRITMTYYSDTEFLDRLGSWSYEVPCNSSSNCKDPNGKVVTLGPSAPEQFGNAPTFTGVRSAEISYTGAGNRGLGFDNLMYFDVQTELGKLSNRFCTAGNRNRDDSGEEAENFVPLDGSSVYEPEFDPARDCSGTESEGNAQFVSENAEPLEAVACSNKKLTVGACEGGSNGNKQIQFSIGDDISQLDPNGVQIEDSPATCRSKRGKLDCKATCTLAVYEAVSESGEATVYADLKQFGSYTFGACAMRAK